MQDSAPATRSQQWLGHEEKIWLDESEEAVKNGIATEALVDRLTLTPARMRSNALWRWLVRTVIGILAILTTVLISAYLQLVKKSEALDSALRAEAELRLVESGKADISGLGEDGFIVGGLKLLAAEAVFPTGIQASPAIEEAVANVTVFKWIKEVEAPILSISLAQYADLLVTAHSDGSVQTWAASTGAPLGSQVRFHQDASEIRFSADERLIAVLDQGALLFSDPLLQRLDPNVPGRPAFALAAAFDSSSKLAIAGLSGDLTVWDIQSREVLFHQVRATAPATVAIDFSGDGRLLVVATVDGSLEMWDLGAKKLIRKMPVGLRIDRLAVDERGTRIILSADRGYLGILDPSSSRLVQLLPTRENVKSTKVGFLRRGKQSLPQT